jgi:hypothetical protein
MTDSVKKLKIVRKYSVPTVDTVRGHKVGRIVALTDEGWLVECGAPSGGVLARTTLTLDSAAMREAAEQGRDALLVFEGEDVMKPIVIGLLAPAPSASPEVVPAPPTGQPTKPLNPLVALVDGKRVVIDAQDEIVLRCGEASITLRRNGRVVVRGTYVETRSRGVNRIKGGTVQIN